MCELERAAVRSAQKQKHPGVSTETDPKEMHDQPNPGTVFDLMDTEVKSKILQSNVEFVANSTYTLENVYAAKFLQVYGAQQSFGANVTIWDNPDHRESQWLIRKSIDGNAFVVENVNAAGEYLQVYGGDRKNGADVKIWNNPERPETQWRIRRTIGSDDTYTLENVYAA